MPSDFSIRLAARKIKRGGIIAYPTDTIYGLGCDPYNADAVEHINCIKQRPLGKQFILLAGHFEQIASLIIVTNEQRHLIETNSEPTSWIINASNSAPTWLSDDKSTVTIRISQNKVVQKLTAILGHAIISTSANISGSAPAKNNIDIRKYFGRSLEAILATNKNRIAKPSKIIRLCDNYVIRK